MNWVDLVVLIFIGLFAVAGYYKGALRQTIDISSLLLSIFLSVTFYSSVAILVANMFSISESIAKIISFFSIWIFSQMIFNILLLFFYPLIPSRIRSAKINKLSGAIPGLLWGAFFVSLIIVVISTLPIRSNYKNDVLDSRSGRLVTENASGLEGHVARVVDDIMKQAITFRTVRPDSSETSELGYTVPAERLKVDEASENRMLELVNEERAKAGLRPLEMDDDLVRLARAHSRDMFIRGYFAHVNPDGKDPFDRMNDYGINYRVAGENLALAPSVELAHEGLMNSPGHRANILTAEFGKVGIGCIDGGSYGKMFSQQFTD
jgi:uncharacterized protein YkwD